MFEVSIQDQKGQMVTACKYCEDVVEGCKKCKDADNSETSQKKVVCDTCQRNYYLVQEGNETKCTPCTKWGQSCKRCNLEGGCTDCGQNYWEMGGICIKSWF